MKLLATTKLQNCISYKANPRKYGEQGNLTARFYPTHREGRVLPKLGMSKKLLKTKSLSMFEDRHLLEAGSVALGAGCGCRFRFCCWLLPGGGGRRRPPSLGIWGSLGRSSASSAPMSASLSALVFPRASLLHSLK